jgi:hypothetical protein
MAVESSDDRADFLNTSDFGLAGTYTPNGETSDVSSAASGDTLTVSSVGYTVIGVQEDGQGMTNLVLELT